MRAETCRAEARFINPAFAKAPAKRSTQALKTEQLAEADCIFLLVGCQQPAYTLSPMDPLDP